MTLPHLSNTICLLSAQLFEGIPAKGDDRSEAANNKLAAILRACKKPREEGTANIHYVSLLDTFKMLVLHMNTDLVGKRQKVFLDRDNKDVYPTQSKKGSSPIVDLSNLGKSKLHRKCLADVMTPAQETWIVLQVLKAVYGKYYPGGDPDMPRGSHVVPPQLNPLNPKNGTRSTFTQDDVDFFRDRVAKIGAARKKEELDHPPRKDRYSYFDFAEAFARVDGSKKRSIDEISNGSDDSVADDASDTETVADEYASAMQASLHGNEFFAA